MFKKVLEKIDRGILWLQGRHRALQSMEQVVEYLQNDERVALTRSVLEMVLQRKLPWVANDWELAATTAHEQYTEACQQAIEDFYFRAVAALPEGDEGRDLVEAEEQMTALFAAETLADYIKARPGDEVKT